MTIGSLFAGAFRLIKERPGAVLIWAIIQLVVTIAASFALAAIVQGGIEAVLSGDTLQSVQTSTTLQSLLVSFVSLIVTTILYAAAQRAVIRPSEGGPGFLRVGMDELRLFLLMLLYILIFVVAAVILGVVLGVFLAGAAADAKRIMVLVIALIALVAGCYFGTKLSLTFPLTLKERSFQIGEGWALTNGRFWTLFATFLLIFLIMLAFGVLVLALTQPDYLSAIFNYGFNSPVAQQAALQEYQMLMTGTIDATIVIKWVLTAVQGAIGYALIGGAAATAVQQLTADEEGLSETFS